MKYYFLFDINKIMIVISYIYDNMIFFYHSQIIFNLLNVK